MSFEEEVKNAREDQETEVSEEKEEQLVEEGDDAVQQEEGGDDEGQVEGGSEEKKEQPEPEEDKEKLRKQEEYRERMRRKREEARQAEQQSKVDRAVSRNEVQTGDDLDELRQLARQQKFERAIAQAERELNELERPFKEAFDDYDDVVNRALEFSKVRLVNNGVSEAQAEEYLRREKVLLADRAAAQGLDPVEAVYNEAKAINSSFEAFAKKMGYVKSERPKTNLQAAKKMSRPNAVTAGTGGGTLAARKTFEELGDDDMEELDKMPLGALGWKRR